MTLANQLFKEANIFAGFAIDIEAFFNNTDPLTICIGDEKKTLTNCFAPERYGWDRGFRTAEVSGVFQWGSTTEDYAIARNFVPTLHPELGECVCFWTQNQEWTIVYRQ